MNMVIKSLHLTNFKGVKDETYVFDGMDSIVSGANGTGKTTIAVSWLWLMADKDVALHSNPDIRPMNVEECTPRVEAVIDIDGKTITLVKQQKRTVSKPNADGISKISLTNTYEINSVPKSERDFKQYLSDLGVDFDRFLPLSHADVFTAQKTADMRKTLFDMAELMSDAEVASGMDDVEQLAELLGNYNIEEITAMQKATLRKIADEYGKDGEILRAKIEAKEHEKVEVDLSALELQKADAKRRLQAIKDELDYMAEASRRAAEIDSQIMQIKFDQADYVRNYGAELRDAIQKLNNQKSDIKSEISRINNEKSDIEIRLFNYASYVPQLEARRNEIETSRNNLQDAIYDEEKAICPTCKRRYSANKVEALRAEYEAYKAQEVKRYNADLFDTLQRIDTTKAEIEAKQKRIDELNFELSDALVREDQINAELTTLQNGTVAPAESTDGYKEFETKISDLQAKRDALAVDYARKMELDTVSAEFTELINGIEREIGRSAINEQIDEHIAELRQAQITYEQNKADAEQILYQVSLLNKRKNELLTDTINSHFKLVKWMLFRYAKNGNYEDCCVATVDGKELGVSTNNALGIRAKVDICEGLQNYYGQHYPILLDNIEAIDTAGRKTMFTDSQLIMFAVTDTALTVGEA